MHLRAGIENETASLLDRFTLKISLGLNQFLRRTVSYCYFGTP